MNFVEIGFKCFYSVSFYKKPLRHNVEEIVEATFEIGF